MVFSFLKLFEVLWVFDLGALKVCLFPYFCILIEKLGNAGSDITDLVLSHTSNENGY